MPTWKKVILENSAPLVSSSAIVTGEQLTNGYVTSITPSTLVNTILSDLNIAMGRLAPTRPAGLTGRGLRVTNTTYQSGLLHSSNWGALAGTTPLLQVVTSSNISLTSSQASTAEADAQVQFSASTALGGAPAGVNVVTFGSSVTGPTGGTQGVLTVGNVTSSDSGFWYTFSASIANTTAPQTVGTFSSASYILRETAGGTVASQSIFTDTVLTPTISSVTDNATNLATFSTYISGVPALTASSTFVSTSFTVNSAVGKFFSTPMYSITSNWFDIDTTLTTPRTSNPASNSTPSSGSSVTFTDVALTVKSNVSGTNVYSTAPSFVLTPRSIVGNGTATPTQTLTDIVIDSVSNERPRLYSSASGYPNQNFFTTNVWNSATSLTNAVNSYAGGIYEMQLYGGRYKKPSGDFSNVFNGGYPDYSTGFGSYATGSFMVTASVNIANKSAVTLTMAGVNLPSTNTTTFVTSNMDVLVKLKAGGNFSKWLNANASYVSNGSSDGLAVVTGTTTGTSTSIIKTLNIAADTSFGAGTKTIDTVYFLIRVYDGSSYNAQISQTITLA